MVIEQFLNGTEVSAFLITDGSVVQGPSALSLQKYNTTFNGTTLRIYN